MGSYLITAKHAHDLTATAIAALIAGAGITDAETADRLQEGPEFAISTDKGAIYGKVYPSYRTVPGVSSRSKSFMPGWIHMRFIEGGAGVLGVNPYNGKWNFHFDSNADTHTQRSEKLAERLKSLNASNFILL